MVTSPSARQEDSLAEQREPGAAVHLALDHLDPVDVAFDDPEFQGRVRTVTDGGVMALMWRK
jgi:hypothetical protein